MAQQQVQYKEHTIIVDVTGDRPKLTIDGKDVGMYERMEPTGNKRYGTGILGYREFDTPLDVAKALIDGGGLDAVK